MPTLNWIGKEAVVKHHKEVPFRLPEPVPDLSCGNSESEHFYGRLGDFDSREEFECACWMDVQAQQGRIQFWVRNLVRREGSSFFLQKADGRFYPDFLCQLPGSVDKPGAILAVEYKGVGTEPASSPQ